MRQQLGVTAVGVIAVKTTLNSEQSLTFDLPSFCDGPSFSKITIKKKYSFKHQDKTTSEKNCGIFYQKSQWKYYLTLRQSVINSVLSTLPEICKLNKNYD